MIEAVRGRYGKGYWGRQGGQMVGMVGHGVNRKSFAW